VRRIPLIALCLLTLSACDFPYDAEGTLRRVRETGVLRVGISEHPPWVSVSEDKIGGVEPNLALAWADQLGARVEWKRASETELVQDLAERRIDLIMGGLRTGSPWASEAAATQPYSGDHIMLVPPGENALLLSLDRFLAGARQAGDIEEAGGA
jgi:polar amino acid transport system substrate-binding protein